MSNSNSTLRQQLTGVLPPITMPFDMKGELVKGGLREQIDFIRDCPLEIFMPV